MSDQATPTDIQSAIDGLGRVEFDIDDPAYDWIVDACTKARAVIEDLRKDRERLEWMAERSAGIRPLYKASGFYLEWFNGDGDALDLETDAPRFREAIDEAMAPTGTEGPLQPA
jgi:hypothetical protein